jgi:succinate dehydrogenase flavin-adding protein (antitoxin of CptAB toxin-antitoxin module)
MRELDAVLERFLADAYVSLPGADKRRFEELLELPDPELHAYLVGRSVPPDRELAALIMSIRDAVRA